MLVNNSKKFKNILEAKGFNRTSSEEKAFVIMQKLDTHIDELVEIIEESNEIKKVLNESGIKKFSITGGNLGFCPVCGKEL